jgi:hypothetical protein
MALWNKSKECRQAVLAQTGFVVSLGSLLVFWLADVIRSGFVSRYFSPHIFAVLAILFAVWWLRMRTQKNKHHPWLRIFSLIFLSFLFLLIVFICGEGFGAFRIVFSLLAAGAPWLFITLIDSKN